jgi:hypothetical protein
MITSLSEKMGSIKNLEDNVTFKNTISRLRLVNIMTTNGCHTWNNKIGGKHQIIVRLDSFIIFEYVIQTGATFEAKILPRARSLSGQYVFLGRA